VVFGSIKVAISLKRVKIEEKLLWRAYRNSPTLFRTAPSPTHYGLPFTKIGGFATLTQDSDFYRHYLIGMGEATDFKFGRNIHRGHPNRSLLKIFEQRERGHIQGLPKDF